MFKNQLVSHAIAAAVVLFGCEGMDDAEGETLRQTEPGSTAMDPAIDGGISSSGGGGPLDGGRVDAGPADGGRVGTEPTHNEIDVRNPSGAFSVSVNPSGTGCPRGTTYTSISSDGKTITTSFSAFEVYVDKKKSIAVKECQLAFKFKSSTGLSYAVTEFNHQGYAFIEAGQTASQVSQYQFHPRTPAAAEARTEFVGPYDDIYGSHDEIDQANLVWSPCGVERDLSIRSIIRLRNDSKKDGYINLSSVDGIPDAKIRFKLEWRKCPS
jgi:uncharacterized protein DUF4360